MARYEVEHDEGMNYVKIVLNDETVRAEAGALCYMRGDVYMDARIPSVGQFFRSVLSNESIVRPTYSGSGEVYLESSYGGFHIFTLLDETWILNSGSYWASDDTVELSFRMMHPYLALRAGEGLWHFETKISGSGQVVLTAPGTVEEMTLDNETLVADGKFVIARTEGVSFSVRRAARSFWGGLIAGEGRAHVYSGTGRVMLSSVPYWRYAMSNELGLEI